MTVQESQFHGWNRSPQMPSGWEEVPGSRAGGTGGAAPPSGARALLGTITRSSHRFADQLKAQPDTLLYELTEANREEIAALAEAQLRAGIGPLSV